MDNDRADPTEAAVDVVETIKAKSALRIFHLNIVRIRELLKAASTGIDKSKELLADLLSRITKAKDNPTEEDEGEKPKVERRDGGMIELRLDADEINLIHEALSWNSALVGDLHFHLHNILCVAAWGAFEGFMQSALAELYTTDSRLLSSEKRVSVAEIIEAGGGLTEYLVAMEIDDIGRKSFDDLQAYLKSRLQIQFSKKHSTQLRDAYFLRNVIAHSAGFLRKDQLGQVPNGVDVENGELRISQKYLEGVLLCVEAAVAQFAAQLRQKFGAPGRSPDCKPGKSAMTYPNTDKEKRGRRGRPRKTGRPGK